MQRRPPAPRSAPTPAKGTPSGGRSRRYPSPVRQVPAHRLQHPDPAPEGVAQCSIAREQLDLAGRPGSAIRRVQQPPVHQQPCDQGGEQFLPPDIPTQPMLRQRHRLGVGASAGVRSTFRPTPMTTGRHRVQPGCRPTLPGCPSMLSAGKITSFGHFHAGRNTEFPAHLGDRQPSTERHQPERPRRQLRCQRHRQAEQQSGTGGRLPPSIQSTAAGTSAVRMPPAATRAGSGDPSEPPSPRRWSTRSSPADQAPRQTRTAVAPLGILAASGRRGRAPAAGVANKARSSGARTAATAIAPWAHGPGRRSRCYRNARESQRRFHERATSRACRAVDSTTTAGKACGLDRRRAAAENAGSEKAIAKQHAKGKMTARERCCR